MISVSEGGDVTLSGNTCVPESYDWVEDESLSRQEVDRIFSESEPVHLVRPPWRVRFRLAWKALRG